VRLRVGYCQTMFSSLRYCICRTPLSLSRSLALIALLIYAGGACAAPSAPVMGYKIVARYPHSTESYTEGFLDLNGMFYEGTGLAGHSKLLVTQPETGKVLQRLDLAPQYFGEGIVDWGPNLYEWTWQTHVCFVYDRFSLRKIKEFTYSGEGWGMTRTATQIITSDGTATLRFRDPATFGEVRHIVVKDGKQPVEQLNELEFIKGEIYANVWHSDRVARISPQDGHVIAWIDLAGLLPDDQKINAEAVLNGIAYDAQHDRLFVTGKQWPKIFEIKVVEPAHTNLRKR
jgi:glutamine cyclotransferase